MLFLHYNFLFLRIETQMQIGLDFFFNVCHLFAVVLFVSLVESDYVFMGKSCQLFPVFWGQHVVNPCGYLMT